MKKIKIRLCAGHEYCKGMNILLISIDKFPGNGFESFDLEYQLVCKNMPLYDKMKVQIKKMTLDYESTSIGFLFNITEEELALILLGE